MKTATTKWSALSLLAICFLIGSSVNVQAQYTNADLSEEFIFFIDGANVQIPTLEGNVVNDPLNPTSGNKVFEITGQDWAEKGFRWGSNGPAGTVGANLLAMTDTLYGNTDTLYIRIMVDSTAKFKNDWLAFLDTETGGVAGTDDLPFRARWRVPDWARDNQWHDFAIPLPPITKAALDSLQLAFNDTTDVVGTGKDINGNDLLVPVDSLMKYWEYGGAWAASSAVGVWDESDPNWQEFDWFSVKYIGRHQDHADGAGSYWIDYMSIGVPPSELVDTPPSPVATVSASNANGTNTLTWGEVSGSGGYDVYFSESAITDVFADGVVKLGSVPFDGARSYDHTITAPHASLADDFTAFYAVTAKSPFGAQSDPTATSVTGATDVLENYAYELSETAINAVIDALFDGTMPEAATLASFFPDDYVPFTVDENRKQIENGDGGSGDSDISGKWWIGYGAEFDELIIYAEITDDILVFANAAGDRNGAASGAWNNDSIEMGLGNYSPESFIIGSSHGNMEFGDEPDYQFRFGLFADESPFTFVSQVLNAEIPNSQSVSDTSDTGYRLLTLVNTIELSGGDSANVAFDFPDSDGVTTYPFNIGLNDADETGVRETQITWSENAGGDGWWNTPNKWQVIAFVGANRVVTSNDDELTFESPYTFNLDQNYPNPFNPTTNISFTIESAADVTLEVFNVLGQKVAVLANQEKMTAGQHMKVFDASRLSSGVYFYRISTSDNFVATKKMMLIK